MLAEALSQMPTVFDNKILLRGQEYFSQGKVLNIRLSEGLLKARVKGHSGQIYNVHMDLKVWPKQPSHCSCPYQINCKHAAASLLALRQDKDQERSSGGKGVTLNKKLDNWLKNLRIKEETQRAESASHCLIYFLEPSLHGTEHKVKIYLALAKKLKNGKMGKKVIFNSIAKSKKQHFLEEDNEIVAQLMYRCEDFFESFPLRNSDILEKILATGRAFFYGGDDTQIHFGEPLKSECQWVLASNGCQSLKLAHKVIPLLLDTPWYINLENKSLGRLDIPYPSRQLHHLLSVPPISLEEAEVLAKKMSKSFPEFPAPRCYPQKETHTIEPIPHIVFDTAHLMDTRSSWYSLPEMLYTIKVGFIYDGLEVNFEDKSPYAVRFREEKLVQFPRDESFESLKHEELSEYFSYHYASNRESNFYHNLSDIDLILTDFTDVENLTYLYQKIIPALKARGWKISFASDMYEEVISADEVEWFSELNESGYDFFSYQLGILIQDKPVSIVPLVAKLISQYSSEELDKLADDQLVKLSLGEGKALEVELGRIKPLIQLLLQYGIRHINEEQQLKINRYQLMLMQEAEQAMSAVSARWQGAEQVRSRLMQLVRKEQLPEIPLPKAFLAQLRDYQHQGLNWLQFLRDNRLSGILADDMGLGKTIQTLAHLQYEKEQGRIKKASLIIAPTSLVGNWAAEAKRFTPELKILVFHGSDRHEDNFDAYDVVVSTYGLIQRDKSRFLDYSFYYLILDESQFIKNARTKTTQIIQQVPAMHRLCLTGTPLENHLGELWSLFHFLMPGLLGDSAQFRRWFKTPIEKHGDEEKRVLLANRIKPFILRRTKNEVAKELPPKTEMIHTIEISGSQRDLYEAIRMSMEKKVREAIAKQGLNKSHILLLDALLKLRQICCDPKLLSLPEAKIAHNTSAKLDALMELLENLMEEGRRVLIFSQFTSMLKLIEEQIELRKYSYLKLTGQSQNRQALVERFQEGNTPIFLISLKAGGTGLNLTRADTVIHYDPWWNPAVEDQATDRSHRIGQENPVFVYKLITKGTVEEVILSMQERKRQLVEGVLSSNASGMVSLTDQDIVQFFSPIG